MTKDRFFTQAKCTRCRGDLKDGRTMSMFNEDCICMSCSSKEKTDPRYKEAQAADNEQIKQGNYNFKGIGRGDN